MRARTILAVAVIAATATLLVGCGGGGSGDEARSAGTLTLNVIFPPETGAASDKVIPTGTNSVLVRVLDPVSLTALVADTVVARPATGNEARAIVDHIRPGAARILASAHASADGTGPALAQAGVDIEVLGAQTVQVGLALFGVAARVEVTPSAVDLLTTRSAQLQATAYDAIGNVVVGAAVTWASSAAGVASVDASGLLSAIAAGNANVTATDTRDNVVGICAATITNREPQTVVVTPADTGIRVGESAPFAARAFDRDGDQITGAAFDWDTEDHAVATVNAAGVVQAVAGGNTIVTASTPNGTEGSADVQVYLYLVTLTWQGDADLDLHAFGPNWAHANVRQPVIPAGEVVAGVNTEYFAGQAPLPGAYYFAVNYFAGQNPVEAVVTVEGIGSAPFVQQYTLRGANGDDGYPVSRNTPHWFRPADVYISGTDLRVAPADTTVALFDAQP